MKLISTMGRTARPLEAMGLHEQIILSNTLDHRPKKTKESNFKTLIEALEAPLDSEIHQRLKTQEEDFLKQLLKIDATDLDTQETTESRNLSFDKWDFTKVSQANNLVMLEFQSENEAGLFFEMYKQFKKKKEQK